MRQKACLVLILIAAFGFGCAKKVQYAIPDAQIGVSLPKDMYAHPDYRTEWWYYTGILETTDGRMFGFELVFFKRCTDADTVMGVPAWWYSNPGHIAHFAITDISGRKFIYTERRERDYVTCRRGRAGAREDMLWVWNRDWYVKQLGDKQYLYAKMTGYELSLVLTPQKPPVLHGRNGYFQKAEGAHATYYISFTRLQARGTLTIDGVPHEVSGLAWNDHEYGSYQLSKQQAGWDWFSIQLDNGHEVMFYLLRRLDGSYDPFSRAVLIKPDGSTEEVFLNEIRFEKRSFWESGRTEARYPVSWKLEVKRWGLELEVEPYLEFCELLTPRSTRVAYWEGPVKVDGKLAGKPVSGRGYMELCGYERPLKYLTLMWQGF